MAAHPEYTPIRTPEALSNFAYLLDLLQQVDTGNTSGMIKRRLEDVIGRLGQSVSVDRLITDEVFRHRVTGIMRKNLNDWLEAHKDELDTKTVELITPSLARELFQTYYGKDKPYEKIYPGYNDSQKIRLVEESRGLPITGRVGSLLSNYEIKTGEKLKLSMISTGGVKLLNTAILDRNYPEIARLVGQGVTIHFTSMHARKLINGYGVDELLKVIDELLKTKSVVQKNRLIKRLVYIAAELKSEELRNHLQQFHITGSDIINTSALAGNMDWLSEEIEAGGNPDDGIVGAVRIHKEKSAPLEYLLDNGADPVKALDALSGHFGIKPETITMVLQHIDDNFIPSPKFLEEMASKKYYLGHHLQFLTNSLVYQDEFPVEIIEALINSGITIEITNAIEKKNEDYIRKILEINPNAIDARNAVIVASKYFPEMVETFIPLLPPLDIKRQKYVLTSVGKLRDSALLDLLLQDPNNPFEENFPKLVKKYREHVVV